MRWLRTSLRRNGRSHSAAAPCDAPDYEGSDDYTVMPLPFVEISWQDRIRLTTEGGPGIYATPFMTDGLRFDLGVRYDFGRSEDDNDALKGLGDLEVGAVAVIRFGYEAGPVNSRPGGCPRPDRRPQRPDRPPPRRSIRSSCSTTSGSA